MSPAHASGHREGTWTQGCQQAEGENKHWGGLTEARGRDPIFQMQKQEPWEAVVGQEPAYFFAQNLLASAHKGSPLSGGPAIPMHTGSEPRPPRRWVFARGMRVGDGPLTSRTRSHLPAVSSYSPPVSWGVVSRGREEVALCWGGMAWSRGVLSAGRSGSDPRSTLSALARTTGPSQGPWCLPFPPRNGH